MTKTLYIIGNGFDRHHDLPTSYTHFATYLRQKDLELYELMVIYLGLPPHENEELVTILRKIREENESIHISEWNHLEEALAQIHLDSLLDDKRDYIYNGDGDREEWGDFSFEISNTIDRLTKDLRHLFKNFILEVPNKADPNKSRVKLNEDALFLSFNYTDTLERIYQIESKQICYIHHKASSEGPELVLGHAYKRPKTENTTETPPSHLSEKEKDLWLEEKSDQNNHSWELGKEEAISYFEKSHKNTTDCITRESEFFSRISSVKEVLVLGHSISDVDKEYFAKVLELADSQSKWTVSYYEDSAKEELQATLEGLGIDTSRINFVQLNEL